MLLNAAGGFESSRQAAASAAAAANGISNGGGGSSMDIILPAQSSAAASVTLPDVAAASRWARAFVWARDGLMRALVRLYYNYMKKQSSIKRALEQVWLRALAPCFHVSMP